MSELLILLPLYVSYFINRTLLDGDSEMIRNNQWYKSLNRSPHQPPPEVFRIVWSFLYLILGYLLYNFYHSGNQYLLGLLIFNLVLNFAWTPVFSKFKALVLALIMTLLMIFSVIVMIHQINTITNSCTNINSVLLAPYLGWLLAAFYFNFYIIENN